MHSNHGKAQESVSKSSAESGAPLDHAPLRVGLISLGCAKNLVDGEIMLGSLLKGGIEITNDQISADAVIVNTCSFIGSAQEESVDSILEVAAERTARNPGQALIVSGCLPQRYREELPKLLPEVDAFIGIDEVSGIAEIVRKALEIRASRQLTAPNRKSNQAKAKSRLAAPKLEQATAPMISIQPRPRFIPDFATPRFRLTPKHFAYVKIAEGCNHPCSFCTIPRMRGGHRSRALSDIVSEARQLISEGVKELNLISQDSTYYGMDLRPNRAGSISSPERFSAAASTLSADTPTLCTLLRQLDALPGEFWIRLLYTHPAHWTDELIRTIAECRKVARYVDMPLQHIHGNMLQRMRRETSKEYIVDLIDRIRAGVPGIALRTTFIVGFPGETEACFQELIEFIERTKFERLGVFTYSKETGTLASKMERQISKTVKAKRQGIAMEAQRRIAREVSAAAVGRDITVLVEHRAGKKETARAGISSWEHGLLRQAEEDRISTSQLWVARSEADAPDIDGRVFVRGASVTEGFRRVRISGHTDYDLIAE